MYLTVTGFDWYEIDLPISVVFSCIDGFGGDVLCWSQYIFGKMDFCHLAWSTILNYTVKEVPWGFEVPSNPQDINRGYLSSSSVFLLPFFL